MSKSAGDAWMKERKAYPMEAYIAGFNRGQEDAAKKIADLIDGNTDLLKSFAGERTPEMIVHLLRHLSPDDVPTRSDADS